MREYSRRRNSMSRGSMDSSSDTWGRNTTRQETQRAVAEAPFGDGRVSRRQSHESSWRRMGLRNPFATQTGPIPELETDTGHSGVQNPPKIPIALTVAQRSSSLWQSKCNQGISRHNRNILLSILTLISDGVRVGSPVELGDP